jgi:uncharacterized protein YlaN (UPF0358 family)
MCVNYRSLLKSNIKIELSLLKITVKSVFMVIRCVLSETESLKTSRNGFQRDLKFAYQLSSS